MLSIDDFLDGLGLVGSYHLARQYYGLTEAESWSLAVSKQLAEEGMKDNE